MSDIIKCEKCNGETKINSYNELWCRNCFMLVHACKCNLTKENSSNETIEEHLALKFEMS